MSRPATFLLLLASSLHADLAWLDFQGGETNTAPMHTAFPAVDGTVRQAGDLTFTLHGANLGSRDRGLADTMLTDFAFTDGDGATIRLRISGLSSGGHTVETWHYDGGGFAGAVRIELQRVGDASSTVLLANHAFSTNAASVSFSADGTSDYELLFIENDGNNRARLNGLRIRETGTPSGPPGAIFVDVDGTNTTAAGGSPSPFWTDDLNDPGFTSGNLWRRRTGLGFNATGHREIFEKDANGGVGDATPLVTTVTGLEPGREYGVHVAFLSVPTESWQVKAGLGAGALELFAPTSPVGRVVSLGLSAETNSNRHQYLGFVGNATTDENGTLVLHADDGDGTATNWTTRTWFEGFLIGDPVVVPPLPGDAVEVAPDGAWTWFNDERSIIHHGSLFSGYVKGNGEYGITRRDLATGENHHMIVSTAASRQQDDHNNPSITPLPDGRLLILYSKHIAGNQYYQRTSNVPLPTTNADWGPETVIATPAANTYANTYRLSGEEDAIYNFHRCINFNPTLTISNDLGATWGAPRQFLGTGSGSTRPYPRYCSDNIGRIDLIYTDGHPRDVNNSVYHLYYKDGGLHRTDGSLIDSLANIPLDHDGGERGSVVYPYSADVWGPGQGPDDWIPGGRGWTWDVHYGKDGHPVCVFQVQKDNVTGSGWNHDRIYYYYATWTGTEWRRRFIAHAGRGLYSAEDDYGGGMCLDPEDPRVVYLSTNAASPFALGDIDNVPLSAGERYEIWQGFTADGGLTFDWTPVTENSAADNLRPIVPPAHGRGECLVWFHGTYSSYTNYSTKVIARIGEPLVSYRAWSEDAGVTGGPEADDDGDGLANLLEFALGGDPLDASDRPAPGWSDGAFSFRRPSDLSGIEWELETSGDLSEWFTAAILRQDPKPDFVAGGFAVETTGTGETRLIRSDGPSPDRYFVRLRARSVSP